MFNITGGEIIILLLLALIVLGPDKLPDFVRKAGRFYGEVKKMTGGFQSEFRSAIDEPMREMRETANIAKSWFEEGRAESDVEDEPVVTDETAVLDEVPMLDDEDLPQGDDVEIDEDWESDDDGGEDEGDGDDDPNFYAEDGRLLDADTISRMIAESDEVGAAPSDTEPDTESESETAPSAPIAEPDGPVA